MKSRSARSSSIWHRLALGLAIGVCAVSSGAAQQSPARGFERGLIQSPILTIDSERVFLESAFGQRVIREIEAQGELLAVENRRIEAELEAEERELTEMRATLDAVSFRSKANDFDQKVQQIRRAQAEKGLALNALLDSERVVFQQASAPVLEQLMREAGAAVILESRSVFASASAIEITNDAIALLNETLGSGVTPEE